MPDVISIGSLIVLTALIQMCVAGLIALSAPRALDSSGVLLPLRFAATLLLPLRFAATHPLPLTRRRLASHNSPIHRWIDYKLMITKMDGSGFVPLIQKQLTQHISQLPQTLLDGLNETEASMHTSSLTPALVASNLWIYQGHHSLHYPNPPLPPPPAPPPPPRFRWSPCSSAMLTLSTTSSPHSSISSPASAG